MAKKQRSDQSAHIDRETWRHIIKAAEELFLAKGYKGVSMKDVADAVQVTPAALYYHFPQGKEDLFLSMLQTIFEEWSAGIHQAIKPAHDIRGRLQLLTLYLLALPFNNFPLLMHDAREQIKDTEKRVAVFRQLRGTFLYYITEVFQEAINVGEIRVDIPAYVLANMFQGMIMASHQNIHFPSKEFPTVDVPQIAPIIVSTLLDGIARKEPQR